MEQIYQDRDQFAKLVREVAAPDVGRMGIEILSFTIKVHPDVGRCTLGRAVGAAGESLALTPLLTACPSPPGVSMTAAAACPVSRQLGQEQLGSCLCKQARGESWLITQPPGSEGRCWDGLLLPALPPNVCLKQLTWRVLTPA